MEGLAIVVITAILAYFAPHKKSSVILLDNGKAHNAIVVSNQKGSVVIDKPYIEVDLKENKAPFKSKKLSKEEIENRFKGALDILPPKPVSFILYFKSGSLELTEISKKRLKEALQVIRNRPFCMVDIIGHTDTVGLQEDNIKLSFKRANLVKNLFVKEGANPSLLHVEGYGEEDLLIPTDDEIPEEKNRNVEIFIK